MHQPLFRVSLHKWITVISLMSNAAVVMFKSNISKTSSGVSLRFCSGGQKGLAAGHFKSLQYNEVREETKKKKHGQSQDKIVCRARHSALCPALNDTPASSFLKNSSNQSFSKISKTTFVFTCQNLIVLEKWLWNL